MHRVSRLFKRTETKEKQGLVAFMKGVTDERVRNKKAPFDHPQLCRTSWQPIDSRSS